MGYKETVSYRRNDDTKGGGVATFIKMGLDSEEIKYSPFCIIRWFPALKKSILEIQVTRTPLRGVSGYLFFQY